MDDSSGVLEVMRSWKYDFCWVSALRTSTPTYILIVTAASSVPAVPDAVACRRGHKPDPGRPGANFP